MIKVTISQLRVLEAVARTGSFSSAAKELGIAQPSVSTQLRTIENQSRARLLARDGHNVTPTRLGSEVLPRVRAIVSLFGELEQMLAAERDLERGVLRIGYSTHQFSMPVISRFMEAHPAVKVEARSMASLDLIGLLDSGRIDVAFVTQESKPEKLISQRLRTDRIVLMAPLDHPLSGREHIAWKDLEAYPLIRREESSVTRVIFDDAAKRAGVELKIVLDLGSWGSLQAAVTAGIGCSVALEGEISAEDNVSILSIEDKALHASHYLSCAPEMRGVAAVAALFDTAGQFYDEFITSDCV